MNLLISCVKFALLCVHYRERCLLALQQALESNSNKLSSLAVVGMQVLAALAVFSLAVNPDE